MIISFFASCAEKEVIYSPEQGKQLIDSLFQVRASYLEKEMAEDLDQRLSIEVKPLADSLVKNNQ